MNSTRGQWTIGLILLMGAALAGLAIVYHHFSCDQILEVWDPQDGNRIRRAEKVELWVLGRGEATDPGLPDGSGLQVTETTDVTRALGFINARHALAQDLTYDWTAPLLSTPAASAAWEMALRFMDHETATTLLFDLKQGWVWQTNSDKILKLNSEKQHGYAKYLRELATHE